MPRQVTQYRVFIASPSGLGDERQRFRDRLNHHTLTHAEPKGVMFQPVGWEETTGGAGRPQELINEDIRQCDYAVFVLHDRWGSPSSCNGTKTGVEEEWDLVEELYQSAKVRNIALFFKTVDPGKLRDPGPQLSQVLTFRNRIEAEKRYLFRQYDSLDQFADTLDRHLAQWLRDHEGGAGSLSADRVDLADVTEPSEAGPPNFNFWLAEANKLLDRENPDDPGALFCATRAIGTANSDLEWAQATNAAGIAQGRSGRLDEALAAFITITERLAAHTDHEHAPSYAKALANKAIALGQLGRHQDAISVCDEVIARFGTALEAPLHEEIARALVSKGVALCSLGRQQDAITAYDEVVARFGTAQQARLHELVARALFNKGVTLGDLSRHHDEIAIYDEVVARFGTATETPLREEVAMALVNKGVALTSLGRGQDAITVCDEVVARFGTAQQASLRELVTKVERLAAELRPPLKTR